MPRASKLSAERTKAMDYYNGDMSADMPAQDGRSRAVSTDGADTIDVSLKMAELACIADARGCRSIQPTTS